MNIKPPKGWRKGQTIFNFLTWLTSHGGTINQLGTHAADPFYMEDEMFDQKWRQFIKENK